MSKKTKTKLSKNVIVASVVVVLVVAAVIVGGILLDSPAQERLRRLDERRVSDLRELSYAVDVYWTREGNLPSSLEELANEERIVRELHDPETGDPYEYRVVGYYSYELCAVFALDMAIDDRDYLYRSLWLHGSGRECFQLEAQDVNRVIDR
ncbi:hypothetical protein KAJ02_09325 [Candidatus Bipolaricaulota bacterium]|nr:hypothetical protein [Candidatus Bipolaricaulota bacterium]MCK5586259.1 hypothetical protein [Candidatus Bipolaricaulota bacterium]